MPDLRACLMLPLLVMVACTTAPKETVELAEIVDRQIAAMQVSHEAFVGMYYAKLRQEIDRFIELRWTPKFLDNVIRGTGEQSKIFRAELDEAYKLATVDWDAAVRVSGDDATKALVEKALERAKEENNARLGTVLLEFSEAVQKEIAKQRASMIEPVDKQEAEVLQSLRDSYADLMRGNAAIKGYLASVVKLVEQRDMVLEKLGALDEQRKFVEFAAKASDGAAKALRIAEGADEAVTEFMKLLGKGAPESESDADG